jgi:hypothetical protein
MKTDLPFLMLLRKRLLPVSAICLALALAGCETPGQGAKYGALIGAGVGALSERNIEGAAAGAAIGAGAGALLGYLNKKERGSYYDGDRYLDEPGYYGSDGIYYRDGRPVRRSGYREYSSVPYGRRTGRPGFVRSPYRPYHVIDVAGVPRGARVLDPTCERVFINP